MIGIETRESLLDIETRECLLDIETRESLLDIETRECLLDIETMECLLDIETRESLLDIETSETRESLLDIETREFLLDQGLILERMMSATPGLPITVTTNHTLITVQIYGPGSWLHITETYLRPYQISAMKILCEKSCFGIPEKSDPKVRPNGKTLG